MKNLVPAQAEAAQSLLQNAQAARDQALQNLTAEQRKMLTPLLSQPLAPSGSEIGGFVQAALPGNQPLRDVALPGAKVYARNADGEIDASTVTSTDGSGHFRIFSRPPGSYDICADLVGFATRCQNVAVVNCSAVLHEPISLKPTGTVVRGCVTLQDGSPAVRGSVSSYQTAAEAKVSIANSDGGTVAGPVPVNASGCYVLTNVPASPDMGVVVQYEAASARQAVPSAKLAAAGGGIVNVVLPDDPPTVIAFTATLGGSEVSQAPPGSVVTVKVDASSSANLPLRYRWADSTGASLPGDGDSVQWRLPGTAAANAVFVEVSDGHGGVARASLPVTTGTEPKIVPAALPRFNLITHPAKALRQAFPHSGGDPFIDPNSFMPCVSNNGTTDCSAAAIQYYKTNGVFDSNGHATGSYVNFRTWKAAWGFNDDPRHPNANETRAVYYNNGDLQFGRDMHCLALSGAPAIDPELGLLGTLINVCYVANYSDGTALPGHDPQAAIGNAENNTNPIAAVAMINITVQNLVH